MTKSGGCAADGASSFYICNADGTTSFCVLSSVAASLHTICVLRFLVLLPIFITFAHIMRKNFFLLACLLSLSTCVWGQGIIYVHGNDVCLAFDTNNTESVTIGEDSIYFGKETTFCLPDIDSIAFTSPAGAFMRTGWWGDVCSGYSTYNQQWNTDELPLMEMTAADSICQSAYYYLPTQDYVPSRSPRKVGRKWRYVKSTLTGRRKLQFAELYDKESYDFETPSYGSDGSYTRFDLTSMLVGKQADGVKRMVSYWHHPTEAALYPSGTVVGHCVINDRTMVSTYQTLLFQDSIRCQILFWVEGDVVTCDTIHLFFHSNEEAQAQYEQMDTTDDEFTRFEQYENQIVITEHFHATIDEVLHWLTRLDFEMAQPYFIRKE